VYFFLIKYNLVRLINVLFPGCTVVIFLGVRESMQPLIMNYVFFFWGGGRNTMQPMIREGALLISNFYIFNAFGVFLLKFSYYNPNNNFVLTL